MATGDRNGPKPTKDIVLAAVDAKVDITLVELAEMLRRDHGLAVAPSTVWRLLDRHDMTVKKLGWQNWLSDGLLSVAEWVAGGQWDGQAVGTGSAGA